MLVDEMILKLSADVTGLIEGQKKFEDALESMRSKSEASSKKTVKAANDEDDALKKRNKAEDKATKEREAQAKKQGDALLKLRNDIVAVTAAYVGFSALKNIGENLLTMNTQIGFSADSLGMSEEALNSWIRSAAAFNAGADETTAAFSKINSIQQSIKTGVGFEGSLSALTAYSQSVAMLTGGKVNVDWARLTNRETTGEGFLSELSTEVQKMSLKDATTALGNLGIGPNIARMLHDIESGSVADKLAKAKEEDPAAQEAIRNAKELNQQWARIKTQAKGVADTIENDIMPYLKKFADMASELLGFAKEHPKTTEGVIGAGTAALAGVSAYVSGKMLKDALGFGAKKATAEAAEKAAVNVATRTPVSRIVLGAAVAGSALAALVPSRTPTVSPHMLLPNTTRRLMQHSLPSNTNSSEVHIGQLTVTTQAKDAPGVAAAVSKTLQDWSLATNANVGMQ